ncbi:tripartite motif-containing protein 16-like [Centropristis striata]|uniref:tripartite motif-containing protein 16-like n=1 Tax=Centropristis striata TaxID=184440 RepID=UPI0027DF9A61|nr:tripartite motif-containing protein 16-like [Centropristis striata]
MAQRGIQMEEEKLCCSICLDRLKDPVTIPCGHSYCMSCIKSHWDTEDQKKVYSCPQCRQTFGSRPVLKKNTMLADLVEELKKTGLQPVRADYCFAGPEDVGCDVCTGRKLKAIKSCEQCLVSYCEQHLQPHYESPAFEKHKLVDLSKKLQENICTRHKEVMKIFCRTDQQLICYLCSMDEHKGHRTVTAAAERAERQKEAGLSQIKIQQRIQNREKNVKLLQQEMKALNHYADKAVEDNEKMFRDLIRLIKERSSDVKQQIRSQQKTEVSRVKELQEELEEEISDLRRKCIKLEQLKRTEDDTNFLLQYPSLTHFRESTDLPSSKSTPLQHFDDVAAAVSEARDKIEEILREEWTKISHALTNVDVFLPEAEPETREDLLKYSQRITLDPNTANRKLLLSKGNRKASNTGKKHVYSSHPDRFMKRSQVLSNESLTGRHYWEVKRSGIGMYLAVAYKDISRIGSESEFGVNDKSWALECVGFAFEFSHDNIKTSVSGPESDTMGVYLDHRAGILSFYSVSETMTLLHRVQTTFTQPLYAGLRADHFLGVGSSGEFCEPKDKINERFCCEFVNIGFSNCSTNV